MNLFGNEFTKDPLVLDWYAWSTGGIHLPISNYRHVLRNFVIAFLAASAGKASYRFHLHILCILLIPVARLTVVS